MSFSIISPDAVQQLVLARHAVTIHAQYTLVDARPYTDYLAGHIPGALWLGWENWCEQAPAYAGSVLSQPGYWGVLKDIRSKSHPNSLELAGLTSNSSIIVYADGPASKGREARIAWMLLYWGASNVSLLNGGWPGWLKSGGSVEISIPALRQGQFNAVVQEHRRIRFRQLKQQYLAGNMPLLVDARSRPEFDGEAFDYQPRKGRLPGALHIAFTDLFDKTGHYLSREQYLERIVAVIPRADRIAAYCEVGVRSCLFALLHEVYTGQIVANFDGSMMEWSLDAELPV